MLESNLEVQLVSRSAVDEPEADFRTFVLGVRDSPSGRYIVTGFSEKFGDAMCDLNLENYYVIELVWTLDESENVIEDEAFDRSPESQNNAFQMIQEIIRAESGNLVSQQKDTGMVGPKRIEVEFQRGGIIFQSVASARGAVEKRKVVVTSYLPPSGTFGHTLQGRVYSSVDKTLNKGAEAFHSNQWEIVAIERHLGNNTCSYFHIRKDQQEDAWKKIQEFLATTITSAEVERLHKWEPLKVEPDAWDCYGGAGSYYNRIPSTYKPAVAEFRVSGDEIGAKIHLEQMERLVQADDRSIEEVLADVSPKRGDAKTTSSSAAGQSGSYRGLLCLDCQLPNCNGCEGSFNGFPFVGSGPILIH